MLTQVVLETSNPVTFDIGDVDPDEILILKSISGLTPGDVTLFTGEFARNGGYYQGRRVGQRNPVFNFKLNPNYVDDIEISDVRELLYRQFYEPQATTEGLQVRLVDDRKPDRYFIGYAEKWQGDIFSQDTSAQISTICVDGFLKSTDEITASNEGGWVTVPIVYDGSADTGIELTLNVVTPRPTPITIVNNDQMMTLDGDFIAGDIVTINTVEGERSIKKNGVDVMAVLVAGSDWITLTSVANLLRVYGSVVGDGKAVISEYTYRSSWWGV